MDKQYSTKQNSPPWERDETLAVFWLYHRHIDNLQAIREDSGPGVELARILPGRTGGAVRAKVMNMLHLDPREGEVKWAGRSLSQVSNLVRQIWEEYLSNRNETEQEMLAALDRLISRAPASADTGNSIVAVVRDVSETEQLAIRKGRLHQRRFRRMVLKAYDGKCCVTGMANQSMLVASHIKPWALFPEDRLNIHNGLCLNLLHDKAFDSGQMTITPDGEILVADTLRTAQDPASKMMSGFAGQRIAQAPLHPEQQAFLAHHNEKVFDRVGALKVLKGLRNE